MEQPTHTSCTELYYHIKLQSNRQQLTKRKKNPYYGCGIFFPYCKLLCRGSGRLQRNADSHYYTKRTIHTCSKTQCNRISSLNYRSSVCSFILISKLSCNCYFSFCDKSTQGFMNSNCTKQGFINSKNITFMHLNTALRSPEVGRQ